MITNISDRKDTYFLSIDKAFSNKIKLSLLKKVFFWPKGDCPWRADAAA